jgi:hypothetical protein
MFESNRLAACNHYDNIKSDCNDDYKSYNGGLKYSYLNCRVGCNTCGIYRSYEKSLYTVACITCGSYCQTCADDHNIIIDGCSLLCQACDFKMTENVSTIIMVSIPSFPSVITDIISKYDDSESRAISNWYLLESRVPTKLDCGHTANIPRGTLEDGIAIRCSMCQKMRTTKKILLEVQYRLNSLYVIGAIQDIGVSDKISMVIADYM